MRVDVPGQDDLWLAGGAGFVVAGVSVIVIVTRAGHTAAFGKTPLAGIRAGG
jgi:hypothetical protein